MPRRLELILPWSAHLRTIPGAPSELQAWHWTCSGRHQMPLPGRVVAAPPGVHGGRGQRHPRCGAGLDGRSARSPEKWLPSQATL